MLRLATWNINSVRLRMGLLEQLSSSATPDVICLQETKVEDKLFPLEAIQKIGYEHVAFSGEKSYNGVAILSRLPLTDIQRLQWVGKEDCRHISAKLPDGTELHNFYVPAGGDEPDPEVNPKFDHKLRFVEEMKAWFLANRDKDDRIIIVGDFNIAPREHDVWSHKQLLKIVSHTPAEVERLNALQDSLGWVDVSRHFVPDSEKLYSWWSYRNRDWRKSNRGRRLDHIWVTPALKESLHGMEILTDARDWERPSDHVPVVASLKMVA